MPQLSLLHPFGPPELSFVRSSMRALAGSREGCEGCHRTPLVGETVYFFGDRMVCELGEPFSFLAARLVWGWGKPLRHDEPARSEVVHSSEYELTVKRRFAA